MNARVLVERARTLALVLSLLGGAAFFATFVHDHYPIGQWLFWHYAMYWGCTLVWALGCLGVGHLTLRALRLRLGALEHLAIAFPAGVFAFELAMFCIGLAKGFGAVLFFLLPLFFVAVSIRSLWRFFRRLRRHLQPLRRRVFGFPRFVVVTFGLIALGMVYFVILTPENIQFDARWKHMALAEDYVAHGGVRRFPEGWVFSARPNFTSLLYTWAFLLPGSLLFDRMALSAHLELVVFVMTTLFGIPALVRRLVPKADPRLVWVARFLFPGVLLYDSSVSGGADHIGAAFAVPICLLTLKAWRELDPRHCGLLGAMLAAALLVKETVALMLIPAPVIAISFRALMWLARSLRTRAAPALRLRWLTGPAIAVAAALLFSAPLWLKNLIWYGDPFYPVLNAHFSPRPWTEDAAYKLRYGYELGQMWSPPRTADGLVKSLKVLATFSFVPNNWRQFHGQVPVFGSLFTLLLVPLLFLRGTRRIWLVALWIHVAIFTWYWVHHQDRYLQAIMPLIASATAAILVLAWRSGWPARTAVSGLVGLQIVWGGDVYFIQTHAMIRSPIKKVVDTLSAGYEKKYEERFEIQKRYSIVQAHLPDDSRLLIHDDNNHLGLRAESALDSPLWQYGISYGTLRSPRQVHELLKSFGITHIYWVLEHSSGVDTVAADIMFFDYVLNHAASHNKIRGGMVVRIPDVTPPDRMEGVVAVLNCGAGYPRGLYGVHDLRVPVFGPASSQFPTPREPAPTMEAAMALLDRARFVLLDPKCLPRPPNALHRDFRLVAKRKRVSRGKAYEIWMRNSPTG